jgi:hypothetical protein
MKLALKFEALFEGAGLALGCGVSSGAFFLCYYREDANTRNHSDAAFAFSGFCHLSFRIGLS